MRLIIQNLLEDIMTKIQSFYEPDYAKALGEEVRTYLMGVKLNNMKEPKSLMEKQHIMQHGKDWIAAHPKEHIDFY